MACYVFGNAITNKTLSELPEYQDKTITRLDRAREAYKMKNAEGKAIKARNFVDNLYKDWMCFLEKQVKETNYDHTRCYLVLIYNATGDILSFVSHWDWYGFIGRSPYPARIENGQWAGFLHLQDIGDTLGNSGTVVYRGMNSEGTKLDWMVGWRNPTGIHGFGNCRVYGEVREKDHYNYDDIWHVILDIMDNNKCTYWYDEPTYGKPGSGGVIEVTSGNHAAPLCEAILSLQNVIGFND